jgi:hypothetical protein
MHPFRDEPIPNSLATPTVILSAFPRWQAAANDVLNVMAKGGDPRTAESALDRIDDETPVTVFLAFHIATLCFTQIASDRYRWFDSLKIWAAFESVETWCQGDRTAERLLRTRSLIAIAMSECARALMTAAKEQRESPPARPESSPVVCSQAAVARFLDRCQNTTGLIARLKEGGIIAHFEPPSRRGGKYAIWYADPNLHERALKEISGKSPRRRTKHRKSRNTVE